MLDTTQVLQLDEHGEDISNLDSRNVYFKVAFMVVAFLEALLLGLIPVKSKVFSESPKALGIANSYSGGVFLAIALMHIMPE